MHHILRNAHRLILAAAVMRVRPRAALCVSQLSILLFFTHIAGAAAARPPSLPRRGVLLAPILCTPRRASAAAPEQEDGKIDASLVLNYLAGRVNQRQLAFGAFCAWSLPLGALRASFRALVYETGDWSISVQPRLRREAEVLLGVQQPDALEVVDAEYRREQENSAQNYAALVREARDSYRAYLVVYLGLLLAWQLDQFRTRPDPVRGTAAPPRQQRARMRMPSWMPCEGK